MTSDRYFQTRFSFDPKREVVWRQITAYFHGQGIVPRGGAVLELGSAYCHFINNIDAREKVALDASAISTQYAKPGVRVLTQPCDAPLPLESASIDTVFASNLFEHLTQAQLSATAREVRRVLRTGGRLVIVQPNYTYCARQYFDDYTHVSVYSHVSLRDFFEAHGFAAVIVQPRFLPFSMKSRLPAMPWLVRAYLHSPWRPLAGQMLVVVEPRA